MLLVGAFSGRPALAQKAGTQYMQIFYSGAQNPMGPVIRFSPEFKGQKEVSLAQPDEYMKMFFGESEYVGKVQETRADGSVYIDGIKQKETTSQEKQDNVMRIMSEHMDNVTGLLSKALNEAAADGWEVVEMAAQEKGAMVYLLRKGRK
ncbi:hypothetical protein PK28_15885 [Hymenobacter sp. DG25B]|nr:hypothetical protein PK28_15885 [Hymenobacter sp. DG25B]